MPSLQPATTFLDFITATVRRWYNYNAASIKCAEFICTAFVWDYLLLTQCPTPQELCMFHFHHILLRFLFALFSLSIIQGSFQRQSAAFRCTSWACAPDHTPLHALPLKQAMNRTLDGNTRKFQKRNSSLLHSRQD